MYVLGIETSCDETAASVVKNGYSIVSREMSSSLRLHKKYGGVIPEIASRMQLESITAVVNYALEKARVALPQIGLVSVTDGPGLLGSLVVGVCFAKALSLSQTIPLLGINHLHSHIFANFLRLAQTQHRGKNNNRFFNLPKALPFVALVVSGGHTSLFYVRDVDQIEVIGQTQDDACGEAFDKVAKILGLGYPGGPLIERLARSGNAQRIRFNCSNTTQPLDFSFSGIKTAVLYYTRKQSQESSKQLTIKSAIGHRLICDIAASFQEAVIDTLIKKSLLACRLKSTNRLVVGGGVAANSRLREKFSQQMRRENITISFPHPELCTDNAAMVAALGYWLFKKGYQTDLDLSLNLS